jgi:O-antigen ligase
MSTTILYSRLGPSSAPPDTHKSLVHRIALALVAFTIGAGAIVFSEPAPVDALTIGLMVLLPAIGLVAIRPSLLVILAALLVLAGCAFFASSLATDLGRSATHSAVSLYLYLSAFVFAAFVARSPLAHARLILNSFQVAALIAAAAGIVGYFDLLPGAGELMTKFGRASGTFKDPNVLGAFLVPAIVYQLHLTLTRKPLAALVSAAGLAVLMFAVLLSLSRGAWAATAVAVLVYGYLSFVTAKRNLDRLKLIILAASSAAAVALLVASAMQVDSIGKLIEERAALANSYDVGPDGRFGGHDKARHLILQSPFGLGALEFASQHHSEDVHNVYLSMFLNAGWLGGLLYALIVALTAIYGLRHALKRTASQSLFQVVYAALLATMLLGSLIDTDHWRHFYLLLGVVWGLMIGDRRILRSARLISDRRPLLLRPVIVIPPARRGTRILRQVPILLPPDADTLLPRRPARLVRAHHARPKR